MHLDFKVSSYCVTDVSVIHFIKVRGGKNQVKSYLHFRVWTDKLLPSVQINSIKMEISKFQTCFFKRNSCLIFFQWCTGILFYIVIFLVNYFGLRKSYIVSQKWTLNFGSNFVGYPWLKVITRKKSRHALSACGNTGLVITGQNRRQLNL